LLNGAGDACASLWNLHESAAEALSKQGVLFGIYSQGMIICQFKVHQFISYAYCIIAVSHFVVFKVNIS